MTITASSTVTSPRWRRYKPIDVQPVRVVLLSLNSSSYYSLHASKTTTLIHVNRWPAPTGRGSCLSWTQVPRIKTPCLCLETWSMPMTRLLSSVASQEQRLRSLNTMKSQMSFKLQIEMATFVISGAVAAKPSWCRGLNVSCFVVYRQGWSTTSSSCLSGTHLSASSPLIETNSSGTMTISIRILPATFCACTATSPAHLWQKMRRLHLGCALHFTTSFSTC